MKRQDAPRKKGMKKKRRTEKALCGNIHIKHQALPTILLLPCQVAGSERRLTRASFGSVRSELQKAESIHIQVVRPGVVKSARSAVDLYLCTCRCS